jgi:hypothetical protein
MVGAVRVAAKAGLSMREEINPQLSSVEARTASTE